MHNFWCGYPIKQENLVNQLGTCTKAGRSVSVCAFVLTALMSLQWDVLDGQQSFLSCADRLQHQLEQTWGEEWSFMKSSAHVCYTFCWEVPNDLKHESRATMHLPGNVMYLEAHVPTEFGLLGAFVTHKQNRKLRIKQSHLYGERSEDNVDLLAPRWTKVIYLQTLHCCTR